MSDLIWEDRKRYFGLPLSFTKYGLSENRLFLKRGLLNISEDEIQLYRVKDISITKTLGQRLFNVGTIKVISSDSSHPETFIESVKCPNDVKEMLYRSVEIARSKRKIKTTEIVDSDLDY